MKPPTLASPANLRSEVYSRTGAELFWDRAAMPGLRYEIERDGEVVDTTNGTSFYDDTLAGGVTDTDEVVALDGDRRSGASIVSLTTAPGSSARALIDEDSYEAILREVVRVANPASLVADAETVRQLAFDLEAIGRAIGAG